MPKNKTLFWIAPLAILVLAILVAGGVALELYYWSVVQPGNYRPPVVQNKNLEDSGKGIKIFNLAAGQKITSPLLVSGEARGTWFFEASFPVRIVDANGQVIGSVPTSAKSDWMTNNYVPFEARIEFIAPTTTDGEIIFHNDNPSGLPANDIEFRVPVKF
jgi:hypothetical protein